MAITQIFYNPVPLVQPAIWAAVTPSDTVDLPIPTSSPSNILSSGVCRGLYIDQPGIIKFIPANNQDADVITLNVPGGTEIGGFIRRVLSTGTTATGIFALY